MISSIPPFCNIFLILLFIKTNVKTLGTGKTVYVKIFENSKKLRVNTFSCPQCFVPSVFKTKQFFLSPVFFFDLNFTFPLRMNFRYLTGYDTCLQFDVKFLCPVQIINLLFSDLKCLQRFLYKYF